MKIVRQHCQMLAFRPVPLSKTLTTRHIITLISTTPFRLPLYRYSEFKRLEIEKQVQNMLASVIIESCTSPYSFPVVLAKLKNRKWRFCVDYRKLNSITEDVAQLIPYICYSMKDIAEAKVFSTLDLKSGY